MGLSEVVGRTNGHLNGYSLDTTFHSNHRETQYSQLYGMPALIATGPEVNVDNRPIDSKKAKEDLLGSTSDCEGIGDGWGGHDPYGAVRAQKKEDRRGTIFHGGNIYIRRTKRGSGQYVHCSRRPISGVRMELINGLEVSA